jgi:hypoxanthine phosphoribosyltransferase
VIDQVMGEVLFSERDIAARVEDLARQIVTRKPDIAVPVLTGAFVFAADLLRALARLGLSLPTEFLWLRAYEAKVAGEVTVLAGPGEAVRGKSVLLIDGVLDRGATIVKARALLKEAGAKSVLTAVAVDKLREDALAHADFALFHGVTDFIAGYGMDHAGAERGLPDIVRVE